MLPPPPKHLPHGHFYSTPHYNSCAAGADQSGRGSNDGTDSVPTTSATSTYRSFNGILLTEYGLTLTNGTMLTDEQLHLLYIGKNETYHKLDDINGPVMKYMDFDGTADRWVYKGTTSYDTYVSSIYGLSEHVQPPALVVGFWRRVDPNAPAIVTRHTVRVVDYDGTELGQYTVEHGSEFTVPDELIQDHVDKMYTFDHWTGPTTITSDTVIMAVYSFVIKFEASDSPYGGMAQCLVQSVAIGSKKTTRGGSTGSIGTLTVQETAMTNELESCKLSAQYYDNGGGGVFFNRLKYKWSDQSTWTYANGGLVFSRVVSEGGTYKLSVMYS